MYSWAEIRQTKHAKGPYNELLFLNTEIILSIKQTHLELYSFRNVYILMDFSFLAYGSIIAEYARHLK